MSVIKRVPNLFIYWSNSQFDVWIKKLCGQMRHSKPQSVSPSFNLSSSLFPLSNFVRKKNCPKSHTLNWVIFLNDLLVNDESACILHRERLKIVNWMCLLNNLEVFSLSIFHISPIPFVTFKWCKNDDVFIDICCYSIQIYQHFLVVYFFFVICPKKKNAHQLIYSFNQNIFVHQIRRKCATFYCYVGNLSGEFFVRSSVVVLSRRCLEFIEKNHC